jgi:hypothetical protein
MNDAVDSKQDMGIEGSALMVFQNVKAVVALLKECWSEWSAAA